MTDAYLQKSPDAARVGKSVELLVAASCILASSGRLNVSTPMVDDEGVDLVFHQRDGTATLATQVKARRKSKALLRLGSFRAFVRSETFRVRPNFYLMFVLADGEEATYDLVWLIPSADFDRLAVRTGRGRLRFTASFKEGAGDRFRPYRLTRRELPDRLISILDELEMDRRADRDVMETPPDPRAGS